MSEQEKALKYLDPRENHARDKAIERLNAIPSEFEVMLYLRAKGKYLFAPYALPGMLTEWNIKDGIDICFFDPEELERGYTNQAGIDVKNTEIFDNIFLETGKPQKDGETWSERGAWAEHFKTGTSRYLAFVRGKKFGDHPISLELTESENKRQIVDFYYYNKVEREKLDHRIDIVRGDDVKEYLEKNKGGVAVKDAIAQIVPFNKWTDEYNFPLLQVTKKNGEWQEKQLNKKVALHIQTEKRKTENDTESVRKKFNELRKWQDGIGVNREYLQRLFGLVPDAHTERIRQTGEWLKAYAEQHGDT